MPQILVEVKPSSILSWTWPNSAPACYFVFCKLLRKFLIQWEETYYKRKLKSKDVYQEKHHVKEETCKTLFGKKVYDFKTKRFAFAQQKDKTGD